MNSQRYFYSNLTFHMSLDIVRSFERGLSRSLDESGSNTTVRSFERGLSQKFNTTEHESNLHIRDEHQS